jgi:hypothetical protein
MYGRGDEKSTFDRRGLTFRERVSLRVARRASRAFTRGIKLGHSKIASKATSRARIHTW